MKREDEPDTITIETKTGPKTLHKQVLHGEVVWTVRK